MPVAQISALKPGGSLKLAERDLAGRRGRHAPASGASVELAWSAPRPCCQAGGGGAAAATARVSSPAERAGRTGRPPAPAAQRRPRLFSSSCLSPRCSRDRGSSSAQEIMVGVEFATGPKFWCPVLLCAPPAPVASRRQPGTKSSARKRLEREPWKSSTTTTSCCCRASAAWKAAANATPRSSSAAARFKLPVVPANMKTVVDETICRVAGARTATST